MSKTKHIISGAIKSIDEKNRTVTFVVSDGNVDRHGESLNPNGWMVKNYMNNPVVLFGHKYDELPIGKTIKFWVENANEVLATIEMATHEYAEKVWTLIKGGFLKATSVGFIPKELDEKGEFTWSQMELLEISVVPIPANPRALAKDILGVYKALEKETGEKLLEKETEEEKPGEKSEEKQEAEFSEKQIVQIKELFASSVKELLKEKQQITNQPGDESVASVKEIFLSLRQSFRDDVAKKSELLRDLNAFLKTNQ